MPASEVVDALIAIVLVILLLSLIVQSLQELIKLGLGIKARQLEEALLALFKKAGLKDPLAARNSFLQQVACDFGRTGIIKTSKSKAEEVTKSEILLWLSTQKVDVQLAPLLEAAQGVERLLDQDPRGPAAASFASLQAKIRPFLSSLPSTPEAFTFKTAATLPILSLDPITERITELSRMTPPPHDLECLPGALTRLLQAWSTASIPATGIQNAIDAWFETTTSAFNERYLREMRRWTLGLGLLVVIVFNANLFQIARDAFASPARREMITQNAEAISKLDGKNCAAVDATARTAPKDKPPLVENQALAADNKARAANKKALVAGQKTTQTGSAATAAGETRASDEAPQAGSATNGDADGNTTASQEAKDRVIVDCLQEKLTKASSLAWGLGLQLNAPSKLMASLQGDWTKILEVLLGYLLTTLLLSAGAPFWQDALQSLFGLKKLIASKPGGQEQQGRIA